MRQGREREREIERGEKKKYRVEKSKPERTLMLLKRLGERDKKIFKKIVDGRGDCQRCKREGGKGGEKKTSAEAGTRMLL